MKKLVLLLVLGLAASAQAGILVPNGEFNMYKPGTNYTVGASFPNIRGEYLKDGLGDNVPVTGGVANYADGTTGTAVDAPGWTTPVGDPATNGIAQFFTWGYDPGNTGLSTCLNAFGSWSSGKGNLATSAAPLTRPASPNGDYEISCMANGPAGPMVFDLLVDGVVIVPTSQVDNTYTTDAGDDTSTDWERVSRTYASLPAGEVKILIGVKTDGDYFGSRGRYDNVCFTPEPATMTLLGLGGLALLRRRK